MAPIKIERVLSVSSEDEAHPAANLLKTDYSNKKWKSKTVGEKQISVVLQLAESAKITSIDVGNEHTAFIEILVGKSCSTDEEFKVLLVSSSLMTLQESKSSMNINSVNFFKEEKLCKPVYEEKWDRVKIVCTQPFNKHVQYGLSFIVFQTNVSTNKSPPKLGAFHLKNDNDVSTLLKAGGLFANRNKLNQQSASIAASIRAASTTGKANYSNKNTTDVAVVSPVPKPSTSLEKKKRQATPKVNAKDSDKRKKVTNGKLTDDETPSKKVKNSDGPTTSKAKKVARACVQVFKKREERPFCDLLAGVIFVISGFQNPLRSELRNKALSMGAKYEANWNCSCTHLICAFAHTPKYNEVRGLGKIVKKEWIEDCYSRRMRLPWRRYALDRTDAAQMESEEEVYEEIQRPTPVKRHSSEEDTDDEIERVHQKQKKLNEKKINKRKVGKETKVGDISSTPSTSSAVEQPDDDMTDNNDNTTPTVVIGGINFGLYGTSLNHVHDDDSNDMSISEPLNGNTIKKHKNPKEVCVYDMDTDSEDDVIKPMNGGDLEEIPCYFRGTTLALLDDLSLQDRALITRYIKAHQGKVADEDTDLNTVLYVITEDSSAVDRIKEDFPQVIGIKPEWVFRSHDESKLLPASSFKI